MTQANFSHIETKKKQAFNAKALIAAALEKGDCFALWRLPNETEQQLILAKTLQSLSEEDMLEELPQGFMITPFASPTRNFIPADYFFRFRNGELLQPQTSKETDSHTWLQEQNFSPITSLNFHIQKNKAPFSAEASTFTEFVRKAVKHIEEGVFEKVVPSRTKSIKRTFDALEAFEKLCLRYSTAMVSLISTPAHGTWLGATPETLVSIEDSTLFKTVALAGTKAWHEGIDCKNVAWTQKEIEEQALVERYIISCFKKIRLREYEEHGPKTVVAGNVMHLKSTFTVDMKATNFPQLGSTMLNLLHPTSAVCGMPKEPALDFLQRHEGYDRELYSGYLGPVNIQNNTHLFVNLRCLQLKQDTAILYAGAGVTVDSDPQKEWAETEMKMKTLESVIH
jgi:isochorismate synthase